MAEFVVSEQCRRQTMGEYLDGTEHAVACVDLAEAAQCDRCGEGLSELFSSERRRGAEWEQVQGILTDLAGHCTLCWSQIGDQEASWREHDVEQCPRQWRGLEISTLQQFRSQISYAKNSHTCFRCGISQQWCATRESSEQACQWPFTVTPLLLSILWTARHETLEEEESELRGTQALRDLGYRGEMSDLNAFAHWVGHTHIRPVWGVWMSNGMATVICWLLIVRGFLDQEEIDV